MTLTPTSSGSTETLDRRHSGLPTPSTAPAASARTTGRFRGDLTTDQWWWSPETLALHGLPPDTARPTVRLLLSCAHPDDRAGIQAAFTAAGTAGTPFALEYRVLGAGPAPRTALLVCQPEADRTGRVTALAGLVVDVTADHLLADEQVRRLETEVEQLRRLETEVEQLRAALSSRAAIEQAKGILMLLTSCGDQTAFDLLAHISSHTHRKVRDVAVSIIESATGQRPLPGDVREILQDACPPARSTV